MSWPPGSHLAARRRTGYSVLAAWRRACARPMYLASTRKEAVECPAREALVRSPRKRSRSTRQEGRRKQGFPLQLRVHTFEEVITQLLKAVPGMTRPLAEELAWRVHTTGLAEVYRGGASDCDRVARVLGKRGSSCRCCDAQRSRASLDDVADRHRLGEGVTSCPAGPSPVQASREPTAT